MKKLILPFVILLIALGAFYYSYTNTSGTGLLFGGGANTSKSPTSTDYSGWKTYNNDSFGYSLRYPDAWAETTTLGNGVVIFNNPAYLKERLDSPQDFYKEDYTSVDTSVYENGADTAGGKVEESTDIQKFAPAIYQDLVTPGKEITVGGKPAVIFERRNMVWKPEYPVGMQNCPLQNESDCMVQRGVTKQVWAKLPKGLLLIENFIGRRFDDADGANQIFDQMISSVKFQ